MFIVTASPGIQAEPTTTVAGPLPAFFFQAKDDAGHGTGEPAMEQRRDQERFFSGPAELFFVLFRGEERKKGGRA
jgi:hypothetical protein